MFFRHNFWYFSLSSYAEDSLRERGELNCTERVILRSIRLTTATHPTRISEMRWHHTILDFESISCINFLFFSQFHTSDYTNQFLCLLKHDSSLLHTAKGFHLKQTATSREQTTRRVGPGGECPRNHPYRPSPRDQRRLGTEFALLPRTTDFGENDDDDEQSGTEKGRSFWQRLLQCSLLDFATFWWREEARKFGNRC